jgi:hypothetical protein
VRRNVDHFLLLARRTWEYPDEFDTAEGFTVVPLPWLPAVVRQQQILPGSKDYPQPDAPLPGQPPCVDADDLLAHLLGSGYSHGTILALLDCLLRHQPPRVVAERYGIKARSVSTAKRRVLRSLALTNLG